MEDSANKILQHLEKQGFFAYKVGGYVRDKLLGLPVHDIDIATSARPEQVIGMFPKVIPTGIKHGTVIVVLENQAFEVTTFRVEAEYSDHRRPQIVQFVNRIEEDLGRRDFTINALAMDLRGRIIDPYGGQKDLASGLIRAVGDPKLRFGEDSLRILRAVRFAAQLGFTIEENTWEALYSEGHWLREISVERIHQELVKMIEGPNPILAIKLLSDSSIFPFDDWNHIFQHVLQHPGFSLMKERKAPLDRWTFLFAATKVSDVPYFLQQWRFSKGSIKKIAEMVFLCQMDIKSERQGKKCILKYGTEQMIKAHSIRSMLFPEFTIDKEQWESWNQQLVIRQPSELRVNARQLIEVFGRESGPWIGQALAHLFEKAALGEVDNHFDNLIIEARKVI
ncbi:CCA tRNA nucleotidyltransferase [Ammoniphilus resinae]|uniref:tRNA nucleotidyltransferase (CCA-adding enzyme) n=1 Tax=Ammoniphilus resinae TaxID=861532 RepID=A0ABS4GSZ8_9BACL|nr:tRNA nucleotidyltransferase (CCA-adding enzyme) [Ammoniphilus resinae]